MNTASTPEKQYAINQYLLGANCKMHVVLEWWDDVASVWRGLNDLDTRVGVDWTQGGRRDVFARFNTTPQASAINFQVVNTGGKYSEGSGVSDGVLVPDRLIRLRAGYRLPGNANTTMWMLTPNVDAEFYYTKYLGGKVVVDLVNSGGAPLVHVPTLFATNYDGVNYDAANYSALGYWTGLLDVYDGRVRSVLIVVVDGSPGLRVYYRRLNDDPGVVPPIPTPWTPMGMTTVDGVTAYPVVDTGERYIQVLVVFDGVDYSSELRSVGCNVADEVEYIATQAFRLDTIRFPEPPAPLIPRVVCSGRDIYKRAVDNEVNIQDLSGGVYLGALIKQICDAVGLTYAADSVDALTEFLPRVFATGFAGVKKVDDIFALILQILNKSGQAKQKMYVAWNAALEDAALYVKPRTADYASAFCMSYKYYKDLGTRGKTYDKVMSRLTLYAPGTSVAAETSLGTLAITGAGDFTIAYASGTYFLRLRELARTGSLTLTWKAQTASSLTVTATGTGTASLAVYGCLVTGTTVIGECLNVENLLAGRGQTFKSENALLRDAAEAADSTKGFLEDYGNPVNLANQLVYPYANVIPENNDLVLLVSRYNFDSNLYRVTNCKHHWDIARDDSSFNLEDSGLNFNDVGGGYYDTPFMYYDKGMVYDWTFGPFATPAQITANTKRYKALRFS